MSASYRIVELDVLRWAEARRIIPENAAATYAGRDAYKALFPGPDALRRLMEAVR